MSRGLNSRGLKPAARGSASAADMPMGRLVVVLLGVMLGCGALASATEGPVWAMTMLAAMAGFVAGVLAMGGAE